MLDPVDENIYQNDELKHWGIIGMKWGIRRYQNEDGSLTPEGRERYSKLAKNYSNSVDKFNKASHDNNKPMNFTSEMRKYYKQKDKDEHKLKKALLDDPNFVYKMYNVNKEDKNATRDLNYEYRDLKPVWDFFDDNSYWLLITGGSGNFSSFKKEVEYMIDSYGKNQFPIKIDSKTIKRMHEYSQKLSEIGEREVNQREDIANKLVSELSLEDNSRAENLVRSMIVNSTFDISNVDYQKALRKLNSDDEDIMREQARAEFNQEYVNLTKEIYKNKDMQGFNLRPYTTLKEAQEAYVDEYMRKRKK